MTEGIVEMERLGKVGVCSLTKNIHFVARSQDVRNRRHGRRKVVGGEQRDEVVDFGGDVQLNEHGPAPRSGTWRKMYLNCEFHAGMLEETHASRWSGAGE